MRSIRSMSSLVRVAAVATACTTAASASAATATAPAELLPHQVHLEPDAAGTAWILTSTALVLLMTIPGLALFYGGMVRKKNEISTVAQPLAIAALVTVLWMAGCYGLALGYNENAGLQDWIGSFRCLFLDHVRPDTAHAAAKGLPEMLWIGYQLTFAIITPALIAGAFAERLKFSALLLFTALWSVLVYAPVCHWVWGNGFLAHLGALDFAGGTVVHVNAGVAGLVCCIVLGKRTGYGTENMAPHDLIHTMIGASLLWVGWFGFNAGSAWMADGVAATALLNTQIAAAGAALVWMTIDWIEHKKPGMLGMASGAVGGLVGITPAAGYVTPQSALMIGLACGAACYFGATWIKQRLNYDDSLDAFGVHGLGGIIGALLTGVLADGAINPAAADATLLKQAIGIGVTAVWSGALTFGILMVCKYTVGLRVTPDCEAVGLDIALHGESLHRRSARARRHPDGTKHHPTHRPHGDAGAPSSRS